MITPERISGSFEISDYGDILRRMDECIDNRDLEVAHINADKILTDLLIGIGLTELVEKYEKVGKWYA